MRNLVALAILGLLVVLPANAPACHTGGTSGSAYSSTHTSHAHQSAESAFQKMDANHDGLVTQREFVAAHRKTGTSQAAAQYVQLAARGGTTTRSGVTGMTLQQFKAAHATRSSISHGS